ncbi:small secreted hydrophilic protein [Streptomyces sp. DSM 44917]|uniref:Small secreted hydrophilic protein n=1 Tax=Streptomyces boetiae TaxID=3075541 RepID=A0ABU2L5H4_9ACTN|nr:small secreted hydrophilic protein [Streptomyces sp. DSM 44917]MDT0306815.1 small secreted hydrophilic protein [Streptomyces sp. DSM 44917]
MAFSHRMATLAAVVLIPVGIAGTSFLLSDDPEPPRVPADIELRDPAPPAAPPHEEIVPGPSPTAGSIDDTDPQDDDGDRDAPDDGLGEAGEEDGAQAEDDDGEDAEDLGEGEGDEEDGEDTADGDDGDDG